MIDTTLQKEMKWSYHIILLFKEIGMHVIFLPGEKTELKLIYHPNGELNGDSMEDFYHSLKSVMVVDSDIEPKIDQMIRLLKLTLLK